MVHETTKNDPERIYLEPWPYSPEGRLWSEENVWPLYTWPPEPEGESGRATGVEYIRADLHAAGIARLSRELEAARERCPVCGHKWRRHDPADGRCDAASEDPLRDGAVCPCGRDLAWMQARIAELSRRALAADTEVSDGE